MGYPKTLKKAISNDYIIKKPVIRKWSYEDKQL